MRRFLSIVFLTFPSTLFADTIVSVSTLEAVKVFPRGALYDRKVSLDLPAGTHQVLVSDLPENLDVETLQAYAAGVVVRALEFRTERQTAYKTEKPKEQAEAENAVDAAKRSISGLLNDRSNVEAKIASAELRIKYLKSLADGKLTGNGDQSVQTPEQLAGIVQMIGGQISAATVALTQAKNTLAETDRTLTEAREDLERATETLYAATPLERDTGTAVIDLNTTVAFSGELSLVYMSDDANWEPSYEVSVVQSGAMAKIDIKRLAAVEQYSDEDWVNVAVTLSTSDLNRSSEVYLPQPDIKYTYKPQPLRKVMNESLDQSINGVLAEPEPVEIVQEPSSNYGIELRGQTLEFELGIVSSVRGDGSPKLFRLDNMQADVEVTAEATIGRNDIAVLYAEMENTMGGTMLPGRARLIRDGVLVGEAYVPEVANGDTFDLALGPLNGILVEHRILEVQDGDTGIISSYNQKIEKYEVTVRSLLDYPIDMTTYAALPISESEDLTVDLNTDPKPTEIDIEGRRGVVGWQFSIGAGKEQKITYGWTLKWPEEQMLGQR